MANTLEFAKVFTDTIDTIYKMGSQTSLLDTPTMQDEFNGVDEVKVLKLSVTGLGNYSREDGYPKGKITAQYETMRLTTERGTELNIDRMDDDEVGKIAGRLAGELVKNHVIPELDAYRFAKYATNAGTKKNEDLTDATFIQAIDEAIRVQDENEVPPEGRMLFINSNLRPLLSNSFNRVYKNDSSVSTVITSYNGIPIYYIPPTRFYSEITLNSGASSQWGYVKSSGGKSVNFLLLRKEPIIQVVKFALPKIFTPDENQEKDMWKIQYRQYHDVNFYDNKKKAIYASVKNT